jgi:hypothetical protein
MERLKYIHLSVISVRIIIIWLSLILCCISSKMVASDSLRFIKSIPKVSTTFATDKIGNIYIATNNSLHKYNSNGDSMGYYSSVRSGEISQIDASNPMQIILYNADLNVITLLDRLLVEKNRLDLKKISIYNCPAVSNSADGDMWVYDALNMVLQKVNDKLQMQNTSFNFLQQFATPIHPVFITEQDRLLFLVDTTQGIIKMDAFGNYITTYHFATKEIQYSNQQLVFMQNGQLVIYNTKSISQKTFDLPDAENIIQARVEKNNLYIRYANKVDIYTLQ